ncbi:19484_t:CDS:2 [Gigaspora margarita]|uniref:19484_t:CDS:1 n=1 Tax=Gigaspora margarita TaxID=4874 RepID=A0ABN7UTM1_GIGMA|nr:19484_t:CDS:2 [Gigaspora margarita]
MESILNDISYSKSLNIKTVPTIEPIIKNVLPLNYKYFMDSFEQIPPYEFLGAHENPFKADFRISITNAEDSKVWLQKFMDLHKVMMRETQGRTIKGIRYILSKRFHCIHSHAVKSKQGNLQIETSETSTKSTRNRDTDCPAKLKIQILKNTDRYPCIISLNFHHNHPLKLSHVMSFRPVSNETKNALFELFDAGHNPSSAYYTHWEQMQLKYENDEEILADRAVVPHRNDVYYLHQKYRELRVGDQNGIGMFNRLEKEVIEFNDNNKGNTWMQPYVASEKDKPGQPLILVIVTNLMKRCHTLKEAGELVYMDTTAGLDILNTPLTILSTSTPVGGLPLAVIITLDETADTLSKALDILKRIIQPMAFGDRGSLIGPQIIITDDCKAEKIALQNTWKNATLLLCVFHFLQAMWRWLWDGNHNIHKNDHAILIELIKKIVFSRSEVALSQAYIELTNNQTYLKYPNFQNHFKISWSRRSEWAIAFRQGLPIRNNNTNNYAEAGIRVLKDIIFSRVQAYNVVQIFQFIVNTMDLYYIRRLLAVAHNKLDSFIALRFRLTGWQIGIKDDIEVVDLDSMIFRHKSSKDQNMWYRIDMRLGICECDLTGGPCKHQASVAKHFHVCGLNQIPTMSASKQYHYAYLALGEKRKPLSFYADLHQERIEKDEHTCLIENKDKLRWFYNDLEDLLKQNVPELDNSVQRFVKLYKKHRSKKDTYVLPSVVSFFQTCDRDAGRIMGNNRRPGGKRIRVQVTATSRRREGSKHGIKKIRQGRPKKRSQSNDAKIQEVDRFNMPTRKRHHKKSAHNLSKALSENRPNGVK